MSHHKLVNARLQSEPTKDQCPVAVSTTAKQYTPPSPFALHQLRSDLNYRIAIKLRSGSHAPRRQYSNILGPPAISKRFQSSILLAMDMHEHIPRHRCPADDPAALAHCCRTVRQRIAKGLSRDTQASNRQRVEVCEPPPFATGALVSRIHHLSQTHATLDQCFPSYS